MNGTNVDYYVAGFDSDGKRVGSLICEFDPAKEKNADKLTALKEKAKGIFDGAVILEVITADDYNKYVSGEYVRGSDGKPVAYVAPEPTAEEQKAAKRAVLQATYEADKEEIMKYYLAASIGGDTGTQTELKQELADLDTQFDADMKALDE